MRDSLQIKLEDLRQDQLKELFLILEEVFSTLEIDFYVLGAVARDTWYAKGDRASRTTRDIDFALYVFSGEMYKKALDNLVSDYGFVENREIPFNLTTPFGYTIDLIPFGELSENDDLLPDNYWDHPVFVSGFEDIFRNATVPVKVEGEHLEYKVATLAAIVLLKLIAYDDRPERRTQDPQDIADIIEAFFDIESEVIYEDHKDLFDRDLELHEYAAIVIGREIKEILTENEGLKERIHHILSLSETTQQRMAEAMVSGTRTLEQVNRWFAFINEGIQ